MHNEGTPRYDGPRELAQSLTAFAYSSAAGATWNREGLREDSEYRDLGLAAVTNGRIGVKHIRALKPLTDPTGWHWHTQRAQRQPACHTPVSVSLPVRPHSRSSSAARASKP